ncbi:hypothetical protein RB195_024761 [Necator americanus]|uniref:Uncharacterized protein n=1 Tax=Necator americanus TaxID=51031 RepID=A0ABR1EPG9_NECAM
MGRSFSSGLDAQLHGDEASYTNALLFGICVLYRRTLLETGYGDGVPANDKENENTLSLWQSLKMAIAFFVTMKGCHQFTLSMLSPSLN